MTISILLLLVAFLSMITPPAQSLCSDSIITSPTPCTPNTVRAHIHAAGALAFQNSPPTPTQHRPPHSPPQHKFGFRHRRQKGLRQWCSDHRPKSPCRRFLRCSRRWRPISANAIIDRWRWWSSDKSQDCCEISTRIAEASTASFCRGCQVHSPSAPSDS